MKSHAVLARLQSLRVTGTRAYIVAIVLALAALAVRVPFIDAGFRTAPYLFCFPVIILATFIGGVRPGILAMILTGVGSWFFLLRPFFSFDAPGFSNLISLAGFAAVGSFDIVLIYWLTRALDRNQALADERELLLRELQHRVKNNFQTIQSFLYLQMRQSENEEVKAVLGEANARLAVFVQAHDNIYDVGARIVSREHILRLCERLEKGSRRKVVYEGETAAWPVEPVIRLTMIVNEMIMNGIRHGTGDAATPVIVRLQRQSEDGAFELAVSARGHFPAQFDLGDSKGLGMRIIEGLAAPLRAGLRIERTERQDFLVIRLDEDSFQDA